MPTYFPILHFPPLLENRRKSIPWAMIEPHARQAEKNHGQALEVLAARGGLTEIETLAVLEDRDHQPLDDPQEAMARLEQLVAQYEACLAPLEQVVVPTGGLVVAEAAAKYANSPTWPFVLAFAEQMEAKLEKNRHKGDRDGWLNEETGPLMLRIVDEYGEMATAVAANADPETVANECADIANFAMMVADNYRHHSKEVAQ